MNDRFQVGLKTLPFIRFCRKAKLFELSYISKWAHTNVMFGPSNIGLAPHEFCLCREFADALLLIRGRLKASDDYDVDSFETLLQRRVDYLDRHTQSDGEQAAP